MKRILQVCTALGAFFFLGFHVHLNPYVRPVNVLGSVEVDFSGLRTLPAAENAWGFVRQSATWARGNSQFMDSLLLSLRNSGLLNRTGTFTASNISCGAITCKIRLTVGANESHTSSAYSGNKVFANKFEAWRSTDDAKALEFYFTDSTTPGDTGGLLYYNLNVLNPTTFAGDSVVVESYVSGVPGSLRQTYSWSGGSITGSTGSDRGRVVLEQMDGGVILCFQSIIRFTAGTFNCGGDANPDYYSLGYSQETSAPFRATARATLANNTIDNTSVANPVCGLALASLQLNYGQFNGNGFITDGVTTELSGHPPISRVNNVFSRNGTSGKGGVDGFDDMRQAKIDALAIAFKSVAAPGF